MPAKPHGTWVSRGGAATALPGWCRPFRPFHRDLRPNRLRSRCRCDQGNRRCERSDGHLRPLRPAGGWSREPRPVDNSCSSAPQAACTRERTACRGTIARAPRPVRPSAASPSAAVSIPSGPAIEPTPATDPTVSTDHPRAHRPSCDQVHSTCDQINRPAPSLPVTCDQVDRLRAIRPPPATGLTDSLCRRHARACALDRPLRPSPANPMKGAREPT